MLGLVIHWVSLDIVTFQLEFCLQQTMFMVWAGGLVLGCFAESLPKLLTGKANLPETALSWAGWPRRLRENLQRAEPSWPGCDLGIHFHLAALVFLVCKVEVLLGGLSERGHYQGTLRSLLLVPWNQVSLHPCLQCCGSEQRNQSSCLPGRPPFPRTDRLFQILLC